MIEKRNILQKNKTILHTQKTKIFYRKPKYFTEKKYVRENKIFRKKIFKKKKYLKKFAYYEYHDNDKQRNHCCHNTAIL